MNTANYRLASLEFKIELLERLSRVNANLLEAQGIQQTDLAVMDDLLQGRLHPMVFSGEDLKQMESHLPSGVKDNWVLENVVRTLSLARVKHHQTVRSCGCSLRYHSLAGPITCCMQYMRFHYA